MSGKIRHANFKCSDAKHYRSIVGTYDLEILTLPRTYVSDNTIEQSKIKILDIASAGMLTVKCLEAGDGVFIRERRKTGMGL